ncbi:hypothetical protein ACFL0T_02750 [Candidatus Omnitrophota bacterium]
MAKEQKRLGELLIEKGLITQDQLDVALDEQKTTKEFLGGILINRGSIEEKDLLQALSDQYDMPFVPLDNTYIDWDMVKGYSSSLISDHRCFPIKIDDISVTFAISNPLDTNAMEKAETEARGLKIRFILVTKKDMDEVLERHRRRMQEDIDKMFE